MKRRHWIISRRELRGKSNMLQPAFWPPFKKARKGVHFRHCSWRTVSKSAGPRTLTFSCCKILRKKSIVQENCVRELTAMVFRILSTVSNFVAKCWSTQAVWPHYDCCGSTCQRFLLGLFFWLFVSCAVFMIKYSV